MSGTSCCSPVRPPSRPRKTPRLPVTRSHRVCPRASRTRRRRFRLRNRRLRSPCSRCPSGFPGRLGLSKRPVPVDASTAGASSRQRASSRRSGLSAGPRRIRHLSALRQNLTNQWWRGCRPRQPRRRPGASRFGRPWPVVSGRRADHGRGLGLVTCACHAGGGPVVWRTTSSSGSNSRRGSTGRPASTSRRSVAPRRPLSTSGWRTVVRPT